MRACKLCGGELPLSTVVDGKMRNLQHRKYCLICSPFGQHNTRALADNKTCLCLKCGESDSGNFYLEQSRHRSICKKCFNKHTGARQNATVARARTTLGAKCIACGFDRWLCSLQFHHIDPQKKDPTASSMKGWSWDRVFEELKKCIVLCVNCHFAIHNGIEVFEDRCAEAISIFAPVTQSG